MFVSTSSKGSKNSILEKKKKDEGTAGILG